MIDLYWYPSPNGLKVAIMLEECQLPYRLKSVDITRGEQFDPQFLRVSPNNKIPALVDHEGPGGELPLFESGAILTYLAEKTGLFLSTEPRARYAALQWLFWQVGGLGPMIGQNYHFTHYAPQPVPYAIERFQVETQRLYNVLNKRLEKSPWLGGDHYSIADIACWPWINTHESHRVDLASWQAVNNWFERIRTRPATERAMQKVQQI